MCSAHEADRPSDLLSLATLALRDEPTPASGERATLARIERSLQARSASRSPRLARLVALAVAATLAGMTAWAGASVRVRSWWGLGSPAAEERARVVPPSPPRPAPLPSREVLEVRPPEPATRTAPAPSPRPRRAALPPPPPREEIAAKPDVDALYREAHEAHFVRRDPAAALVAWDRYLAAAGPGGRFSLEARWARALSLVRLRRGEDAAAALRPFADGEYGGYRRDEAVSLLRSLD